MTILGCTRCGTSAPKRGVPSKHPIGQWWMWPTGDDPDQDLLMVCPDCILQLLHDDMERGYKQGSQDG